MTPAPIRLTPAPLAEVFASYGQVLEMPAQAGRQNFAARLVNGRASAKPNLALIRVEPTRLPLTIHTVERLPASSQAFVPLEGGRYLMVVTHRQSAGGPDLASARPSSSFTRGPRPARLVRNGLARPGRKSAELGLSGQAFEPRALARMPIGRCHSPLCHLL